MKKNLIYMVTVSGETMKEDKRKVFSSYKAAYEYVERETVWIECSKNLTKTVVPGQESFEEGWHSCTIFLIHRGENEAASIFATYVITTMEVDGEEQNNANSQK